MVVCKFFLQGTCKFGNTCRFEHQINDNSQGSSILRHSNQIPSSTAAMDPSTLVRFVVSDMTSAEQGKQWVFSCYSPFKDKPAFPGFEDSSFEEIRLGFYEATQNGTVEQYKQMIQLRYQEALGKIKILQNPNESIVKLLTQIYNAPAVNQSSVFQNNTGNSVFASQGVFAGGAQNSTSIFGGNNPQGNSIFGGGQNSNNNSNVFAQKSIFGNNTTNNLPFSSSPSIFGNNNANNVNNSNTPIFGQNNNVNPANNIFAHSGNIPNSNVFTQNTFVPTSQNSIFGNNGIFNSKQNQQTPFTTQKIPQPQSPFGNLTTQPSPFSNPPTQSSSFTVPISQPAPFGNTVIQPTGPFVNTNNNNQNNTQSIFVNTPVQNNQNPNSMFQTKLNPTCVATPSVPNNNQINNMQGSNPVNQPTQNIFAQNNILGNSILNKNTNIFGGQGAQQIAAGEDSWYSKLEELSEEEIKSFQSDHFEFGKIPEKPPTLQMCF